MEKLAKQLHVRVSQEELDRARRLSGTLGMTLSGLVRVFIQIVIGPRQTGKTTAVAQALAGYAHPHLSAEATKNESRTDWLRTQWYRARQLASSGATLLVIDEARPLVVGSAECPLEAFLSGEVELFA